jgi:hypothetical protein
MGLKSRSSLNGLHGKPINFTFPPKDAANTQQKAQIFWMLDGLFLPR